MKKAVWKFGKAFAIVFAALMVLTLASCSGLIQKTGSVSFVVDQELLNAARAPFGGGNDNAFRLEISLEGRGGYKLKQTLVLSDENFENFINKHGLFETSFDSVPAGKSLSALVKVYKDESNSSVEINKPKYIGRSDTFRVKPGNNEVPVVLGNYEKRFEFSIPLDKSNLNPGAQLDLGWGDVYAYVILADSKTGRKILKAGTKNRNILDVLDSIDFENDVIETLHVGLHEGTVYQATLTDYVFNYYITLPADENSPSINGQKVIFLFANADETNTQNIRQEVFAVTNVITPVKGKTNRSNCSFINLRPVVVPNYTLNYENDERYRDQYGYTYYLVDSLEEPLTEPSFSDCGTYTAFDSEGRFYTLAYYQYSNKWLKLFSTNTLLNGSTILQDDFMSYEENSAYKDWNIEYVGFAIDAVTDTFYVFANEKQAREVVSQYYPYDTTYYYNLSSLFHIVKYPDLISSGELTNDETYSNEFPGYLPLRMVVNNGICYCLAKSATDNSYTLFTFALGDEDPTKTKVKIITNLSSLARCTDMVYLNDYVYILFNDNNDSIYGETASYSSYDYNSSGVLVRYDTYTRSAVELGNSNKISFSNMYVGYDGDLYDENGKFVTLSGSIDLTNQEKLSKYFPSVRSPKESKLSTSFIGSDKFLAIEPKKLVVSDFGLFYYTDLNDALVYKKINRVIDVDLEDFVIKTVTNFEDYFSTYDDEYPIQALLMDDAGLEVN